MPESKSLVFKRRLNYIRTVLLSWNVTWSWFCYR